jgi:hypothetical protein
MFSFIFSLTFVVKLVISEWNPHPSQPEIPARNTSEPLPLHVNIVSDVAHGIPVTFFERLSPNDPIFAGRRMLFFSLGFGRSV